MRVAYSIAPDPHGIRAYNRLTKGMLPSKVCLSGSQRGKPGYKKDGDTMENQAVTNKEIDGGSLATAEKIECMEETRLHEENEKRESNLKHLEQVRDRYTREYKNDEITTREFVETMVDVLGGIDEIKKSYATQETA